jgi:cytochrome c oxidase cbb3-type subunit I/II
MTESTTTSTGSGTLTRIDYNDRIVRLFTIASIFWGLVGMLAGALAASQLSWWQMNGHIIETITFGAINVDGISQISFGRLRPLHTNATIFAFVGNMMFAGIYHSTQRLVKARLASNFLSELHFWGWQAIIVGAAITLPLGLSRGKEYAELIWPINIAVVVIWVVFAVNFFWTLARRNERTLYVAIWFYIATIVTVAMLYIVNHLSIPTSLLHSYPIFGGVQDALVQWWYGHNAVAFFLTTPILGIMYYYMPKAAGRPVYSYRLSVVHFWSLVFVYIWAGPHHLLNTALPEWLQSLGMLFSLMLWAPSWGGMLNGLLTLRGAWHKLRDDPVLKFLAAGVTFYGMSTFEGPLLSIKAVNALSHYTDWTIGHVHSGTLGWNGFMAAGMFYWLVPRMWGSKLHSQGLANLHFWIGMVGILLYIASMWVSGIMQGLMLNSVNPDGTLAYFNYLDALNSARIMMHTRLFGGLLYLAGFFLMAWNLWKTARAGAPVNESTEVYQEKSDREKDLGLIGTFWNAPVLYCLAVVAVGCAWAFGNRIVSFLSFIILLLITFGFLYDLKRFAKKWGDWYDRLLASAMPFTVLTLLAVVIGGAIQIIPTALTTDRTTSIDGVSQHLYTPLELAGRDIYVREGCYNCHTQMIRPFVSEVVRYGGSGGYSKLGESMYDYPFQWGSKRTGPDLHRVGGKYGNDWHFRHMWNARDTSPGSNMPNYPWLFTSTLDTSQLPSKMAVLRKLGVPFPSKALRKSRPR